MIAISIFSKLRLTSIVAHFPALQVPDGLSARIAPAMHLVDAATGWCLEFCDRAFFRDGVASFVTEPFLGMGSRVL